MSGILRPLILAFFTLGLLGSASNASSKSRTRNDAGTVGAIELRKTVDCIVERDPRRAARLLTTRPQSPDEVRVAEGLHGTISNCMTGYVDSLTAGYTEMRGFIAEVFYLRENPSEPDFTLLKHEEVPLPADWVPDRRYQNEVVSMYMLKFGSCVTAADPKDVSALIRTEVRSDEELGAINRLKPSLSGCLEKGFTFRLDAAILRALTAQSLYRSLAIWRTPQAAMIPSTNPGKSN